MKTYFFLVTALIFVAVIFIPKSVLAEIATTSDWIGLFEITTPAKGDTKAETVNGTSYGYPSSRDAAGICSRTTPGTTPKLSDPNGCVFTITPLPTTGTFEYRMYANDKETADALIARSSPIQATPAPVAGDSGACPAQTTPRVQNGLISAPNVGNKFGNDSGQCASGEQAAFIPYKIPTYEKLKSLYFTQSKLASSQKITLTGDQTQTAINLQGLAGPAAVTFDAKSSSSSQNPIFSWQHLITNADLLIVAVSIRGTASVSSITYNNQPLTNVYEKSFASDNMRLEMWSLLTPPSGTYDVIVSLNGSATVVGGATSWKGVDQSAPFGTFSFNEGWSSPASVDVTSSTGEVVVDVVARPANCSSTDTAPGQTINWNLCQTPGDTRGLGSRKPGASSVTMSWTLGQNEAWGIVAVPIKPAPPASEKIYHITPGVASGNLTIDSNITVDKTGIIFVDGNLTINSDLTHTNNAAGLVFVVKGNVNIAPGVTRVDAVIISQGTIYTAGTAGVGCTPPVTASQLIINGSLISLDSTKPAVFCRTLGANDSTTPAEQINNQPKYLVILRDMMSDTLQKWSEIQ